ncbi:hypothetical protein T8T21_00760 [Limimaricola variabilis]|uniref:hypothetical protein n=1 Tax=Limimaricola variabilis TaxID=1492771 RepID=UPI002AC98566|nr:hypothetical protein [Limimaricola variabilis]WPY94689.1 hypothetical protein T8T21_00760 [Limimaricola variabilis]
MRCALPEDIGALLNRQGRFRSLAPDGTPGPWRRRFGTAMRDCVYRHEGWGRTARGGVRITLTVSAAALFFPTAVAAGWRIQKVRS